MYLDVLFRRWENLHNPAAFCRRDVGYVESLSCNLHNIRRWHDDQQLLDRSESEHSFVIG